MSKSSWSFGSDPELLLVDETGKYRSAIGIIKGTKTEKIPLGNGHFAFYDNVLAEVNIAPAETKKSVISNFRDCFSRLAKLVGNKFRLIPQSSQTYDKSECEHPDSKEFGCDPEYCIYIKNSFGGPSPVEPPHCVSTFRSGGGHIHIGHQLARDLPDSKPFQLVRLMDTFLGSSSTFLNKDPSAAARRKLYGKAGTHRIQPYGLEYRTLSNFWIQSPKLVDIVYDLTGLCVKLIEHGDEETIFKSISEKEVETAINNGNVRLSRSILERVTKYLPKRTLQHMDAVQDRYDFYKEWKL